MNFLAKTTIIIALCFSSLNSAFALEQADQQAIQDVIKGYTDSWNQKGGKGFADGYTDDADFVNIFGMHFSGKTEIEDRHVQILKTFLKDTTFEVVNLQLREVQPGLVIALVRWKLDGFSTPPSPSNQSIDIREGIYTQVFINTGKQWQITASQNTLIPNKL